MTPKQIKALREKLKMTQPAFAEWLGLKSYEHVLRLEKGTLKPSQRLIMLMQRTK